MRNQVNTTILWCWSCECNNISGLGAGGRKCFWSLLNDSKTIKHRPYVLIGSHRWAIKCAYPDPHIFSNPQTGGGGWKVSLSNCSQTAGRHFLALNLWLGQSYSFQQSPKWVNADRTQYVRSSRSPITIVVIILCIYLLVFIRPLWMWELDVDGWSGNTNPGLWK